MFTFLSITVDVSMKKYGKKYKDNKKVIRKDSSLLISIFYLPYFFFLFYFPEKKYKILHVIYICIDKNEGYKLEGKEKENCKQFS